jgi:hypothetical protein
MGRKVYFLQNHQHNTKITYAVLKNLITEKIHIKSGIYQLTCTDCNQKI